MVYKYSREATIILCIFISTDGWISATEKTHEVCIVSSNDKDWLKKIKKYFRTEKISVSINKGRGKIKIGNSVGKPMFALRLNRRYPKFRGAIRQFQVLRDSIEFWKLHDFIVEYKYNNLCKITKNNYNQLENQSIMK